MPDIISSVSTAITLAKKLKEISINIKNAEFKNLLADLSIELADVKMRLAEVMGENASLKNEIQYIKSQANAGSNLKVKDGMYYDQSGDGPFCTGCYDAKNKVIRLVKQKDPFTEFGEYKCPSCNEFYNSKI